MKEVMKSNTHRSPGLRWYLRSVPKKLIFPTRNEQEVEADLELLDIDGNFFLLQLVMLLLGLQA